MRNLPEADHPTVHRSTSIEESSLEDAHPVGGPIAELDPGSPRSRTEPESGYLRGLVVAVLNPDRTIREFRIGWAE